MHIRRQLDCKKLDVEEVDEFNAIDGSSLLHHSMANKPRGDNAFSLPCLLHKYQSDPAVKVSNLNIMHRVTLSMVLTGKQDFMQLLKNHLLSRLLGLDYDSDEQTFSPEQHNEVHLINIDLVVESKII